ncbi:MAG TPA: hypothetical protein EYP67_07485 [Methanosarcinales archaeon]|nr:hypothetical protein [Methanosarcinales archaeon]
MQTDTGNDIDQQIKMLLSDILAPTNYAELKGVLKTVDLLTDYVKLRNVRTILESDLLFLENRDVAVMALDILRKMHDKEQEQECATCETEVVDTVNEALDRAEPETITLTESKGGTEEVVMVTEPEKTPETAEVEVVAVAATENQASHEAPEAGITIEIPVSAYGLPDSVEYPVDSIDSPTLEPESEQATQGSGFPDSVDSMENQTPDLESEPASLGLELPGLPDDAKLPDSADLVDNPFDYDPEQMPAFPDGEDVPGSPDSADNDQGKQWKQTVQRIKELKTRYVTK